MKKRILSLFLALIMCLSMAPTTALAGNESRAAGNAPASVLVNGVSLTDGTYLSNNSSGGVKHICGRTRKLCSVV